MTNCPVPPSSPAVLPAPPLPRQARQAGLVGRGLAQQGHPPCLDLGEAGVQCSCKTARGAEGTQAKS